jgi:hypothetical protein
MPAALQNAPPIHASRMAGALSRCWKSGLRACCQALGNHTRDGAANANEFTVMNTRASDHYTSHGADFEEQKARDPRASRDIPQPLDPEQHWNELHRTNGLGRDFIERARRHVRNASIADIAGAAVAGLALGYLLFSPRRRHGVRELLLGSLMPAASKGMHGAWDGVRNSRALSDLGDRVSHMGDQVGDRFSHFASRASKLRSRW